MSEVAPRFNSANELRQAMLAGIRPLRQEIGRIIGHGDGGVVEEGAMVRDLRVRSYLEALHEAFDDPNHTPLLTSIYEHFYGPNSRPGNQSPPYVWNLLMRATQRAALNEEFAEYSFPEEFTSKDAWKSVWTWIYDGDTTHRDKGAVNKEAVFDWDLRLRDIQSNIPQRYISIPLIFNILSKMGDARFGHPLRGIDLGCSAHLGAKKLLTPDSPFAPVEVVIDSNNGYNQKIGALSDFINQELVKPLEFEEIQGVDIVAPYDPWVQGWVTSCSRYPSEFLDKKLDEEYAFLNDRNPDEAPFTQIDIASPTMIEDSGLEEGYYDFAFTGTMLYMMTKKQQDRVRANKQRLLKPDGIDIEQDFGYVKKGKFEIYSNASPNNPNTYRTVVRDMSFANETSSDVTIEYFTWSTGRCRQIVKVGKAVLYALVKAGAPGTEALLKAS
jgi:hypothetical protein